MPGIYLFLTVPEAEFPRSKSIWHLIFRYMPSISLSHSGEREPSFHLLTALVPFMEYHLLDVITCKGFTSKCHFGGFNAWIVGGRDTNIQSIATANLGQRQELNASCPDFCFYHFALDYMTTYICLQFLSVPLLRMGRLANPAVHWTSSV